MKSAEYYYSARAESVKIWHMSLLCALIKETVVHYLVLFTQTLQKFDIYDNN
jgi:hypothetical protein